MEIINWYWGFIGVLGFLGVLLNQPLFISSLFSSYSSQDPENRSQLVPRRSSRNSQGFIQKTGSAIEQRVAHFDQRAPTVITLPPFRNYLWGFGRRVAYFLQQIHP
jgi:hypothetical protein